MNDLDHVYDVAVSFASEQRPYVHRVVRACETRGLRVFYDRDRVFDFWGTNVIRELRKVYGGTQARYFVPFLSAEYLVKKYPMDEFNTALVQALGRGYDYILPVVVHSAQVPDDLLSPAVGVLRAEEHSPEELAEKLVRKVMRAPDSPPPRTVASTLEDLLRGSRSESPRLEMRAHAEGAARIYQAGRDQHITER